jgi:hypothetical protein
MLDDGTNDPVVARAREGSARCLAATDIEAALVELRGAVALYRRMGARETARAEAYLAELNQSRSDQPRSNRPGANRSGGQK